MSDPHNSASPLTAEDIKALRKATTICLRYNGYNAQIEAINRKFGETNETRREMRTNHKATVYAGLDGSTYSHEMREAFAYISSAQYSPHWLTIASLLKPGDVLRLVWVAGGRSTWA